MLRDEDIARLRADAADYLTDNNQSEYARERAALARGERSGTSADKATTNTDQPAPQFSLGDTPTAQPPPINATTGCTTLPKDSVDMSTEIDSNQQSAIDTVLDPPFRSLRPDEIFDSIQRTEKDPPAPAPDVYIKDFNAPEERGVPTPLENSEIPHVNILFDGPPSVPGGPRFVEVEDMEGNSISIGTWVELGAGYYYRWVLRIPDLRWLLDQYRKQLGELAAFRDRVMALTAQNQGLQTENGRFAFTLDGERQKTIELRGANTSLLRRITELTEANRKIGRERHELAKALQIANETMKISIERINSLLAIKS